MSSLFLVTLEHSVRDVGVLKGRVSTFLNYCLSVSVLVCLCVYLVLMLMLCPLSVGGIDPCPRAEQTTAVRLELCLGLTNCYVSGIVRCLCT